MCSVLLSNGDVCSFFGSFGSNDNILLNGREFVSYLMEAQEVNLLIKRHPRKMTVLSWFHKSGFGGRTTKRFYPQAELCKKSPLHGGVACGR